MERMRFENQGTLEGENREIGGEAQLKPKINHAGGRDTPDSTHRRQIVISQEKNKIKNKATIGEISYRDVQRMKGFAPVSHVLKRDWSFYEVLGHMVPV